MIKHPSSTKTQVICDKCRVVVEFAAGMTDDEANREIQRHGWDVSNPAKIWRHICGLCWQEKWGTH
jgi:Fe2+ or Zn2+ uptake regulation protein